MDTPTHTLDHVDRHPTAGVPVLIRVWLPDRPGALGLVASRIGALRGDIIGVDVLERGENVAVDEVAVVLPDASVLAILVREIEEVDGVSVEEVRDVATFPDPRLDALEGAIRFVEADDVEDLQRVFVEHLVADFGGDWAALVGPAMVTATGAAPEEPVLRALVEGTAASEAVADGTTGPEDLAVAPLSTHAASALVGRQEHPLRLRERLQLRALARIADRAWTLLEN